jgi:hypothetical protein
MHVSPAYSSEHESFVSNWRYNTIWLLEKDWALNSGKASKAFLLMKLGWILYVPLSNLGGLAGRSQGVGAMQNRSRWSHHSWSWEIAQTGKPRDLSSGMSSYAELDQTVDLKEKKGWFFYFAVYYRLITCQNSMVWMWFSN